MNGEATSSDFTRGSNKKVWWLCPKGHSYEATIKNRTKSIRPSSCPYCSGRKATPNKTLAAHSPEVAKQWHPTKNSPLEPTEIGYGSSQKVWWICATDLSHLWEAVISNRTKEKNPTGCPYCAGSLLIPENNSLQAKNPAIAAEWHPSKNGDLKPSEVRYGSGDKAWWLCPERHEYESIIRNRTKRTNPSGCPYCAGKLASETNSLAALGGEKLLSEWDKDKNQDLNPSEVLAGSHSKAWWTCERGHSWEAHIGSRVRGAGCPFCSNQSSVPEVRILSELEFIFPEIISRHKEGKTEIDLFIPSLRVGVEYDGSYFHKAKEEKDKAKTQTLLDEGIHLIRARELPLKRLSNLDIEVSQKGVTKKDIDSILKNILQAAADSATTEILTKAEEYLQSRGFTNEDLFRKYVEYFPDPLPQNALINTHPDVAGEWHPTKNTPLTPKNFMPGSNAKAWWSCPKGHEYETNIISRTTGHGCPVCSGNIVHESTSLNTTHPELTKEWHPNKNGDLLPSKVSKGSTRKVWWKCEKCNHEWEAVIYNRSKSKNPSGCPRCWSERRKDLPRQRKVEKDL
jgi:very-short-patch-repair endonuclease